MDTLVEAAGRYLVAGLSLIAVSGKLPNAKYHRHGLNDPFAGDVSYLEQVFGDESTTGIAVVLPNQVVVVDIDGEEGAQQWAKLAERHGFDPIPDTATARTGRGLHLWYLNAGDVPNGALGTKLDVKTQGGYVLVPPARHPSGAVYEWLIPLVEGSRVVNIDWYPL